MKYKARKVGNSIGVTIPTFVTETLGIKNGTPLNIELNQKRIIIRKEEKEC